jgi:hypothetical protein
MIKNFSIFRVYLQQRESTVRLGEIRLYFVQKTPYHITVDRSVDLGPIEIKFDIGFATWMMWYRPEEQLSCVTGE